MFFLSESSLVFLYLRKKKKKPKPKRKTCFQKICHSNIFPTSELYQSGLGKVYQSGFGNTDVDCGVELLWNSKLVV